MELVKNWPVGNTPDSEKKSFRHKRIEKLLHELLYEIERGLHQREIDEILNYSFIYPNSQKIPGGCVRFDMRMRPIHFYPSTIEEKMRIVRPSEKD